MKIIFLLGLFKLGQHALTIGGMQEDDWLAMSADFGLLNISKNKSNLKRVFDKTFVQQSNALGLAILHGLEDVVHLDANMMDSAVLVLCQETRNWRLLAVRIEQLDFGVWQVDKDGGDAMLG